MLGGSLQFIGLLGKHWSRSCTWCCPLHLSLLPSSLGGDFSIKESLSLKVSLFHLQLLVFSLTMINRTLSAGLLFIIADATEKGYQRCRTRHFFLCLLLRYSYRHSCSLFMMIPRWTVKLFWTKCQNGSLIWMQIGGTLVMPWRQHDAWMKYILCDWFALAAVSQLTLIALEHQRSASIYSTFLRKV